MSFSLTSRATFEATYRQYPIDNEAPIKLRLSTSKSYCKLNDIENENFKKILWKVGATFEKNLKIFFHVLHTFKPIEAADNKDNGSLDNSTEEDPATQVKDIFPFIETALSEQTNGNAALSLKDVTRLTLRKEAFWIENSENAAQEHDVCIEISDAAQEALEKAGLVFKKLVHFSLASHAPFQAAIRQYLINPNAPIKLRLSTSKSYCNLDTIKNDHFKKILLKVGIPFEKNLCNFSNVNHRFTPIEAVEDLGNSTEENPATHQIQDVFPFIETALSEQTNGNAALGLEDITSLTVGKAIDRGFLMGTARVYDISVNISDAAQEAFEKAGLLAFKQFATYSPKPNSVAFILGIGQKTW